MSAEKNRLRLFIGILLCLGFVCWRPAEAMSATQYLLFQIFTGAAEPSSLFHRSTGVFRSGVAKPKLLATARHIAELLRPTEPKPDRVLGFSVGPIAMDQGRDDAKRVIREAFDIAVETNLAVAFHLDDYMFWKAARLEDGKKLSDQADAIEWRDWERQPAAPLEISWLPHVPLAPQLCYESPPVTDYVAYWAKNVIGAELKAQIDRLAAAGKAELFAGVIVGWESSFSDGYCSLSHLGYSAQEPPADFDKERERILQRHIERWSKAMVEAGVPKQQVYTHVAPMPSGDYRRLVANRSRDAIRAMPQSAVFNGYWVAFNGYANPGFSAYVDPSRFQDIYDALATNGGRVWAMSEGTNVVLTQSGASHSPLDWETYLGRSFNHGAAVVNLFGGFQGPQAGAFQRATESPEAIAAYKKFLGGEVLVESPDP